MTHSVIAVEVSENRKLGLASCTMVSQESCPDDCPLLDGGGCYGNYGPLGRITATLNKAPDRRADAIAYKEAKAIDRLTGRLPLRGRVVGDSRTERSACVFAAAAERHRRKYGQPVWTYTHAWRVIRRVCWGNVSVLASCESVQQAEQAAARGYAAALIVPEFRSESAYRLGSLKVIPCPYQTRGVQCSDCRLCWDDQRLLRAGLVVGFSAHGAGKNRVLEQLD